MGSQDSSFTYTNPIIPGFAPDPSVVFVDGTFFLCTSSFHVFPGLPIYASHDLKKWTLIGNALNRRSQLSLKGAATIHVPLDTGFSMVASMGIVAPSIHHHRGTFYIVTTNTTMSGDQYKTNNFIIHTKDIWSGEWSDPVYFDFNGIDTSLFFDDDERVYVQGSWMTGQRDKQPTATIKQVEIDIASGELLSETKEIWPGWAKYDTEGPHIYKVGQYYYLMVAEGGTFEHHMLSIARSTNIWGPYESAQTNPIMTADGKDEYIQNIGHGDLFQDGNGSWWAAVLGVRKQQDGTLGLGRESFLSPVDWPEGGWPTVRQPKMSFTREDVPNVPDSSARKPLDAHSFLEDLHIRDYEPSHYVYEYSGTTLRLTPSIMDLSSPEETSTFLGRRQRFLNGSASATLDLVASKHIGKVKAGLALYKDPVRFASLSYSFDTSAIELVIHNSASKLYSSTQMHLPGPASHLDLRITSSTRPQSPNLYTFDVSVRSAEFGGGSSWTEVGRMDAKALDARDFTGPLFGVFAHGAGELEESRVVFRDFELHSDDDE